MTWAYVEAAGLQIIAPIVRHVKWRVKVMLASFLSPKQTPDMSNLQRENICFRLTVLKVPVSGG